MREKIMSIARRIDRFQRDGDLYDVSRNIARFSAFLEEMEERIEVSDCPQFRETILRMLMDGRDHATMMEYVMKAVEHDASWRVLLATAERQAQIQTRAAELALRGSQNISARAVIAMISRMLQIVAEENEKERGRKIMKRIWREVMAIDPEAGSAGLPIGVSLPASPLSDDVPTGEATLTDTAPHATIIPQPDSSAQVSPSL